MPIKFAFESTFGGTWGTDEKNDIQDRICVRVADFDYSHFKVIDSPSTIRNISEPELFSKSLQYGDILIEKSGGGEKTLVGRAVRFTGDYKAVCSNFVSVLRPKSNQSSRFWTYVLANLYANRGTYPYIKQSTGIQNLDVPAFLSQKIQVPSFLEQERIADQLDHELAEIDTSMADQNQLLKLVDERRATLLDENLAPYWDKTVALKFLGKLRAGITLGASYPGETKNYPYLRVANVQAGYLDLSHIKEISVPVSVAQQNTLSTGDVLLTEGGDRDKLGRGALWSGQISPMLHQNHIYSFTCNSLMLLPQFLVYCLESNEARKYFETTARQSTNLSTTNSFLVRNFKIPNVKLNNQLEIVEKLDKESLINKKLNYDIRNIIQNYEDKRISLINSLIINKI
ncbi:restriction endonuclease subunit S [Rothia amarae]